GRDDPDLVPGVAGLVDETGRIESEGAIAAIEGGPLVVARVAHAGGAHRAVGHHGREHVQSLDVAVAAKVELAVLGEQATAIIEDRIVDVVRTARAPRS